MKTNLKRLLALFMALMLLTTFGASVFALGDWDTYDEEEYDYPELVLVLLSSHYADMKVNESTQISAYVEGEGAGARYEWRSSNPSVVTVSGSGKTATIRAVGAGHAEVALTVTSSDNRSDFDYIDIDVAANNPPVSVSGGGSVSMDEGDSKNISASVSGGSGSYVYDWETDGSGVVNIIDNMRGNAEIYAGRAGSGRVTLTVYDAENYSNSATVSWNVTVNKTREYSPPVVELSRGTIDLGAGGTASLSLSVSGGSGSYEYYWASDNESAVTVSGSGSTVTLRAASSLVPGANQAQILVCAYDTQSGLVSEIASCTVIVTGGSTAYNAYTEGRVGENIAMNPLANEISGVSSVDFGRGVNYSANIVFTSPSSYVGSLCLQDGTVVRSGTNYSFASFQDMFFRAGASGNFTTSYRLTDSGNTIEGTITVSVSGGIPLTSAYLGVSSVSLPTHSSRNLNISVTPANASYDVVWESANSRLVSVSKSGQNAVLKSGGSTGTTTITTTVYDSNGFYTTCTCSVTVYNDSSSDSDYINYNLSMTVVLGSDYYGTRLADSMSDKFRDVFRVYPTENDTIFFTSLGDSRYGKIYDRNGNALVANRNYTFRDWIDAYFIPSAAGTYTARYQLQHGSYSMRGEIKVTVQAANISVSMDPTALRMSPYSSQYINLTISPSTASYRVRWATSNANVASVSGSNATAVINTSSNGTASIYAYITDSRGVEIVKTCSVLVNSTGSVFNPSVTTTLGIPYTGTGASSAMRSQFSAVYNTTLPDSAIIRFSSTGNTDVGVMRLSNGSMIRPDTDYTLSQFVAMYVQPVSEGTYGVPYTLTYAGKSLTGTVSTIISAASISTNVNLSSNNEYSFATPSANGSNGGSLFADSIRNAVGSNWGYLRFGSVSNGNGTLYASSSRTAISTSANVMPNSLSQLYFVPGSQNGIFTAPYTVYTTNGNVLATGTLNITRPGSGFTDVPSNAYYAQAVNWAVSKGITSGTGGSLFSPDMIVTRGQAVTFLWRANGQPKAPGAVNPFEDVPKGAYYYDAVLWAVQQGITNGTSDKTFSPDNQLNRDQLLTFLCRANGGYAGGSDWSNLAVKWATDRGLLAGVPGTFPANSACPRCDVVYYLWKNYNG